MRERWRGGRQSLGGVTRNVWLLGVTSLLTDISSEMVVAVLPVYAIYFLKLSPAAFGIVDAVQQGGASLVKLASGWFTDRSRQHKSVAAAGYSASALSRLGLLLAGPSAAWLTPLIALDRIGKGIRTAPRDALISLSVNRRVLATAFGVHRALDTAGAMVGPLLGFALLQWIHDGYDVVFVISAALGAIGVAVLVTFVTAPARTIADTVVTSGTRLAWSPAFIRLAVSAGVLGVASISDSFVYLSLQRALGFSSAYLPLLYVATPAVCLSLAAPAGWIADRIGHARVILVGYASLLGVYVTLGSSLPPVPYAVSSVMLLGVFYAATDGVFAALASRELPTGTRATGLALVSSANDGGRMIASVMFGWLWSRASAAPVREFQVVLVVAIALAFWLMGPVLRSAPSEDAS